MAIQLIPFAVGAAIASATVYVLKDAALRHSIADKFQFLGHGRSSFLGKPEAGGQQAESSTPAPAQQQPRPVSQPSQSFARLSAMDEQAVPDSSPPEQQAPQPAIEPEQASVTLSVDCGQTAPDTTAAEQQTPQPAVEPEPELEQESAALSAALSADDAQTASDTSAAKLQAPEPVQQPDQHHCAAKTKAGHRCRSRTHAIVSMPQEAGGVAEVPLCSVHSRIHQQGGTVTLVG